ncbi:hypothetical protein [Micromonospora qiuiae]|nr:hypothetical protein [Micromonospora qiuiae]
MLLNSMIGIDLGDGEPPSFGSLWITAIADQHLEEHHGAYSADRC